MKGMKTRKLTILLVVAVLATASFACRFPGLNAAVRDQVVPSVMVGDLPPIDLTLEANRGTVVLSEAQINTLLAQELAKRGEDMVQDPYIDLIPGGMIIQGNVQQGGWTLPLRLELQVAADGQGGVTYSLVSASIGPLPLPDSMRQKIDDALRSTLSSEIARATDYIYIEQLSITDDTLTASGYKR
jgi:hypothetical protein